MNTPRFNSKINGIFFFIMMIGPVSLQAGEFECKALSLHAKQYLQEEKLHQVNVQNDDAGKTSQVTISENLPGGESYTTEPVIVSRALVDKLVSKCFKNELDRDWDDCQFDYLKKRVPEKLVFAASSVSNLFAVEARRKLRQPIAELDEVWYPHHKFQISRMSHAEVLQGKVGAFVGNFVVTFKDEKDAVLGRSLGVSRSMSECKTPRKRGRE